MRRIAQRRQFRNDLKREKRRGKDIDDLIAAVELLAEQGALPPAYRAHKLSGEWSGVWHAREPMPTCSPESGCACLEQDVRHAGALYLTFAVRVGTFEQELVVRRVQLEMVCQGGMGVSAVAVPNKLTARPCELNDCGGIIRVDIRSRETLRVHGERGAADVYWRALSASSGAIGPRPSCCTIARQLDPRPLSGRY